MKLKYYLRGLVVGIICTAILMGIALSGNKKEKLTDTEIIERAKLLGMVMADESSEAGGTDAEGQDAKSKNQPGQNAEAKDPSKQDIEDPSETGTESKDKDVGESKPSKESGDKTPSGTDAEGKEENGQESGAQEEPGTDSKNKDVGESQPGQKSDSKSPSGTDTGMVEFEIGERDHSEDVSRKLFEAGLIEDASDFNQYMIEKKMDDHLQTGKYQIPKGATKDEILELIVRLP